MAKKKPETGETQAASKNQPIPTNYRKGDVLSEGELDEVAGGIITPRDPASGLPTGKRMHKPFAVSSEVDIATP